jgi:hypothetical protein
MRKLILTVGCVLVLYMSAALPLLLIARSGKLAARQTINQQWIHAVSNSAIYRATEEQSQALGHDAMPVIT